MTQPITWAEALVQGQQAALRKQELKALKRTLGLASHVIMRVAGVKQMQLFSNRGWELMSSVPLGRGAGITSYLMRKERKLVELDMTSDLIPNLEAEDPMAELVEWIENHHKKFPDQTSESFMTGVRTVSRLMKSGF